MTPPSLDPKGHSSLRALIARYRDRRGVAIPLLADIQRQFGYLPHDVVEEAARALDIPAAELFGVATFYSMFRLKPLGKHVIRLCRGTACHVQGSLRIAEELQRRLGVAEGDTTEDGLFTLQFVACLGCCSLAPVMMVGEDVHGRLTPEKAIKVLDGYREGKG
ncbi:MAG: NADH-ubiquinone oxidoreductase chain E [Candidatus Bipolaricaulis sibiricus]|uniref:NADH-ubiquinone oxidoreductase chain E n=1 Tax=Bipolaricaulis sibiricus TaxID=2501609 RepID=A0A410FTE9_BIPS1|nr:MAG: NADH-ubiquinone oxidoreductase chain E [Candidatus Bipolaricaulis sibiricus]